MSNFDTPRTKAAQHNMGSVMEPHYVVDVEFAEQLERELASANSALEGYRAIANLLSANAIACPRCHPYRCGHAVSVRCAEPPKYE